MSFEGHRRERERDYKRGESNHAQTRVWRGEQRRREEGGSPLRPVFQKISHWRLVEWRWLQPEPKVLSNRLGEGLGSGLQLQGAPEAASRNPEPRRPLGQWQVPQNIHLKHGFRPKQGFLNSAEGRRQGFSLGRRFPGTRPRD